MTVAPALPVADAFRHEALLYAGQAGFVAGTAPFVREGVEAGEPVFVVVGAVNAGALRDELGRDAAAVMFADMAEIGTNPARIIPAWLRFVEDHAGPGQPVRGIGEPIWPARTAAEVVECQRHESLVNLAFDDGPAWRLMCPYDTDRLAREVLAEALNSHPYVHTDGQLEASRAYRGLSAIAAPFTDPLPEPPVSAQDLAFDAHTIGALRAFVGHYASEAGYARSRRDDLVLAVNELATNSVKYGGGQGRLRIWDEGDDLVCDIRDGGFIQDPMVGRLPPPVTTNGGRGLWLANHLCDLVQVRSDPTGSVVRVRLRKP